MDERELLKERFKSAVSSAVRAISENFDLEIIPIDERLSTKSAISSLVLQKTNTGKEKHRVDETAAAIILQEFLDSK